MPDTMPSHAEPLLEEAATNRGGLSAKQATLFVLLGFCFATLLNAMVYGISEQRLAESKINMATFLQPRPSALQRSQALPNVPVAKLSKVAPERLQPLRSGSYIYTTGTLEKPAAAGTEQYVYGGKPNMEFQEAALKLERDIEEAEAQAALQAELEVAMAESLVIEAKNKKKKSAEDAPPPPAEDAPATAADEAPAPAAPEEAAEPTPAPAPTEPQGEHSEDKAKGKWFKDDKGDFILKGD